jgi:hypothetical protein
MNLKINLLFAALSLLSFSAVKSQTQALLHNDTLTLSNAVIKRQYLWNNGEILSLNLTDNKTGKNLLIGPSQAVLKVNNHFPLKNSTFETEWVTEDNTHRSCLKAEVILDYGNFRLKRVFRISENVPAIGCDNYIRINNDTTFQVADDFFRKPVAIENLNTAFHYPRLKAVEFFDRTDVNNNLVRTVEAHSYTRPLELKGNLLKVHPAGPGQAGIFILKEAPCSFVQLDYPGYDFKSVKNTITVEGAGLPEGVLPAGEWIKLYGSVVGVFDGTEPGFMRSLRIYQNSIRRTIPERDDMVMMNTWGDRNQDASISEQFLKAELDACEKLGITHFQIDDGWQQGLSVNSANKTGAKWDVWSKEDWVPNKERLPNGLNPIVEYARKKGVQLGLWFHPSNHNSYENWETDAEVILGLYRDYGICYFKIDGIQLPDKLADHRLRFLFDRVSTESNGDIVINLDATAGNRTGYHYMNSYGNIFLENRYTDWGNYYPHWTLRNLWQLSAYVPSKNLQIEFLNKWRNRDVYGDNNPLAPYAIPFEYQFAIAMMAQPLAWFEGTGLPEEACKIGPVIKNYRTFQKELHSGDVFPIGNEPNGYSWTGFQSLINEHSGYLLVFREKNSESSCFLKTLLTPDKPVVLTPILGKGKVTKAIPGAGREIRFELPEEFSYCLYKYIIGDGLF